MRRSPDYSEARGDRYERERSDHYDSRDERDSKRRRYDRDKRPRREYDSDRNRDSNRHKRGEGYDSRRARSPQARSSSPGRRSRVALPSQVDSFRKEVNPSSDQAPPKEQRNFKPTGILAKEANRVAGTTTILKYHEPPEARKPPASQQWRMYVFKEKELLDTILLFERSCWLVGRDEKITDLHLEHSSISKQHAVIQFRLLSTTNEYGDKINRVKPYLIDLESANGTELNGKPVETSRYVELVDGDAVKFGDSEREYVMMLPPPTNKK